MADEMEIPGKSGTKRRLSEDLQTNEGFDTQENYNSDNNTELGRVLKRKCAPSERVCEMGDGSTELPTTGSGDLGENTMHTDAGQSQEDNSNHGSSDDNDCASTASHVSDIITLSMSDLDDIDSDGEPKEGWRPVHGPISWVQRQMMRGENPRDVLRKLVPVDTELPDDLDELTLWKIIINLVTEPPKRDKLPHINTLDDVVHLLRSCSKVMVLTGAGVSVSCGIPDFRSRDGIYARLSVEYPDLPDPQAMFDIRYFRRNPQPFFKFAKEIYPGQFQPSTSHKFIQLLEQHGKLLRNYTQNIDTLEQVAGIHNVIQCHGSFATATCMVCKHKVDLEVVRADIMNQVLPHCGQCSTDDPLAIMKPDIVFFGESLPDEFHNQMDEDKDNCDLLIVIGSSLKVRPVALIPQSLPAAVPQILINREPLKHMDFDVELLGDGDVIINELCNRLGAGWTGICTKPPLREEEVSLPSPSSSHSGSSAAGAGHVGQWDTAEEVKSGPSGATCDVKTSNGGTSVEATGDVRPVTSEVTTGTGDVKPVTSVSSCEVRPVTSEAPGDVKLMDDLTGDVTPVTSDATGDVKLLTSESEATGDVKLLTSESEATGDVKLLTSESEATGDVKQVTSEATGDVKPVTDVKLVTSEATGDVTNEATPDANKPVTSTSDEATVGTIDDNAQTSASRQHRQIKETPELCLKATEETFLFLPPNRYIFQGAENCARMRFSFDDLSSDSSLSSDDSISDASASASADENGRTSLRSPQPSCSNVLRPGDPSPELLQPSVQVQTAAGLVKQTNNGQQVLPDATELTKGDEQSEDLAGNGNSSSNVCTLSDV